MSSLYSNPSTNTLDVLIGGQTYGQFGSAPTVPTKVATAVSAGDATRFDQVIGLGQTWQDLFASRSLGVTYTNSTGKPIMMSFAYNAPAANISGNVLVNGASVAVLYGNSSSHNYPRAFIVIPPNATYSVSVAGASTILFWYELR